MNVLGLNVCPDAAVPALKLPAIGRFAPTPLEIEHPSAPPESAWPSGSSANAITRLGSPDSALEGTGFELSVPLAP